MWEILIFGDCNLYQVAQVAELVDACVSGTYASTAWGFESPPGYTLNYEILPRPFWFLPISYFIFAVKPNGRPSTASTAGVGFDII